MSRVERLAWFLLACTLLLGLVCVAAVVSQGFVACPDESSVGDPFKEAFSALVDIVKWGIGLAAGVVGLLGLQALRVKEGPQYSRAGQLLLVSVVSAMCLSIYFGLRWRTLVAQAWFLKCPNLVTDSFLQRSFDFHTYFFMGGFLLLALMAALMLFPPKA